MLELRLQIRDGDTVFRNARINEYVEWLRRCLIADFEAGLILSGRKCHAFLVPHVPDNAIQSGCLRYPRGRRAEPSRRRGIWIFRLSLAGTNDAAASSPACGRRRIAVVRVDDRSFRIEDFDCHRSVGRARQIVFDRRPQRGRINSGAISVARFEEMCVGSAHLRRELMEGTDIVQDPKGPALRRDDQIVSMKFDVANGHVRQIQLERLPVRAVVERDEDAEFSSGVK